MFQREEHRAVLGVLGSLDSDLLERHSTYFGGGTRLVLDMGEYRVSRDIDFLCSDARSYAALRREVRANGQAILFKPLTDTGLELPREARADQYGIRFPVISAGVPMKLEIVREARFELGPGIRPEWSPVLCLCVEDCYVAKLLANSDRWPDRQVLARDLIDLCFLRQRRGPVPSAAWTRAGTAYGKAAREDLQKALDQFMGDPGHQRRCFHGLDVTDPDEVLRGARNLQRDLRSL